MGEWKKPHECSECGRLHTQNQVLCGRCEQDRRHPERVVKRKNRATALIGGTRVRSMNTRARQLGLPGRVGLPEARALATPDAKCPYCGQLVVDGVFDHKKPLSRGGGHTIDNLAWVCKLCNAAKHDMTMGEFMARIGLIYRHLFET